MDSAVKDVTSEFTPKYSLNNTRVDIDLNRSNMNKGKRYIITQAVKPSYWQCYYKLRINSLW